MAAAAPVGRCPSTGAVRRPRLRGERTGTDAAPIPPGPSRADDISAPAPAAEDLPAPGPARAEDVAAPGLAAEDVAAPGDPDDIHAPAAAGSDDLAGPESPSWDGLAGLLEAGAAELDRVVAQQQLITRASAERARALAAFARCRPASGFDRAPGQVGAASAASRAARPAVLTEVSEWAIDEVAVRLRLTPPAAERLLLTSLILDEQLPATLDALAAGRIGWEHATALTEILPALTDPALRAGVEARLLDRIGTKTHTQLRAAAHRAVARADAEAAARRAAAVLREREVRLYPGRDGLGVLSATLPLPVARACHDALERYAKACAVEGDERSHGQRMTDCLTDLILRPGHTGLPPVQAQLTVTAPAATLLGGNEPGEVDGDLIPAAMVRELAHTLGLLPRPTDRNAADTRAGEDCTGRDTTTDPATDTAAPAPGTDTAGTAMSTADDRPSPEATSAADRRRTALGELLATRRIAGTALTELPRIAVVDELTGALLALTDATTIRAGHALGPPPPTPGYRPRDALDRFVRHRDRRCRFPGCRARPRTCDLDHQIPHARGGPTAHANLCCLCEHHHRLSHQAPGWSMHPAPDGGIRWTLPGGTQATTHPPAYDTDDDLPPDHPTANQPTHDSADVPPF